MRDDKENIIVSKTIDFALSIISYCEVLEQHRKFVIAKQLLRSGTSIGAINAAILVSFFLENKTWHGSSEKLELFWK